MNCNPFTLGHQYLIQYAAEKVDYLYIFVVQEDRSFFSFETRMEMVRKGTELISNVIVAPSGKFILSYETLPIYFEKTEKQEAVVDASQDLEIFGRYIAPELGIKYRFVGEELTDLVTRQYNEQMKGILSGYGVELVEIPRKKANGKPISASTVREYIQAGNPEACRELVPETTYRKIVSMFS